MPICRWSCIGPLTRSHCAQQPLVLSIGMDGSPRVRTASQNVTVYNTTEVNLVLRFPAIALQLLLTNLVPTLQYANLIIHSVDNVIQAPLNLTATLGAANLTQIAGALSMVSPDLPAMLAETPRLTIFGE